MKSTPSQVSFKRIMNNPHLQWNSVPIIYEFEWSTSKLTSTRHQSAWTYMTWHAKILDLTQFRQTDKFDRRIEIAFLHSSAFVSACSCILYTRNPNFKRKRQAYPFEKRSKVAIRFWKKSTTIRTIKSLPQFWIKWMYSIINLNSKLDPFSA